MRTIMNILNNYGGGFFPLTEGGIFEFKENTERVNNRFNEIKKITESTEDIDRLNKDDIAKIAYDQIIKDLESGTKYFLETYKLNKYLVDKSSLYKNRNLRHLIERLESGITPNAIENSASDRQSADMVEIINAAWFYKISLPDIGNDPIAIEQRYKLKDRMNNLTLKAIEYSEIESNYRAKVGTIPEEQ